MATSTISECVKKFNLPPNYRVKILHNRLSQSNTVSIMIEKQVSGFVWKPIAAEYTKFTTVERVCKLIETLWITARDSERAEREVEGIIGVYYSDGSCHRD